MYQMRILDTLNSIPIDLVLDRLWVKYDQRSSKLYQEWELTSWWSINKSWNYICDFSWKSRPCWWPYAFV